MMARTQTTSIRVKPPSPGPRSVRPADNIGGGSCAALLPVGAIGRDVIRTVLPWRAINILLAPRVVRNHTALQIRAVPCRNRSGILHQRRQSFRRVGITAGVEIEQIERT